MSIGPRKIRFWIFRVGCNLARRKILCKRFSTKSRMREGSARAEGWTPSLPKSNGELSGMRAVRRECQTTAVEH